MFPENTMGVIDVHSFGTILACLPVEEGRNVSPEANKNENRWRVNKKRTDREQNRLRGVRSIGWSYNKPS